MLHASVRTVGEVAGEGNGIVRREQRPGAVRFAQQEDRVRERNAGNRSSSGLLDLFGPARNLDLVHSAKENWRREWDMMHLKKSKQDRPVRKAS